MSEWLVVWGMIVAALSGLPGLFLGRNSMRGQWVSTLLAVLAAGLGLGGVVWFWTSGDSHPIVMPWAIPGGEFNVALDGLSAFFLVPVFLVSLLADIYGLGYWRQTEHPQNGRRLRLFYGTLTAGMALQVIARNGILFLFGWEIMGLSTFFLIMTEGQDKDVQEAGWIYLVVTHTATLCLFAVFALLRAGSGSFLLAPLEEGALAPGVATVIFVLSLVGFGSKAGIMPLHIWLPSAHAVAPSHVSAIMSGVNIKVAMYGLIRVTSLMPAPPLAWGAIVLALGVVSGVLGVAFAIGQHDLKRLLAYHSIENIGIIVIGLGLALLGRSFGRDDWVILGLGGCLLHVWNHGLFKALLFLSAGSVIHAVHTREIDHLGGLAKSMPWTSLCFVVGSVAICGLPPLNGFVSEFLIYIGLFRSLANGEGPTFAGAAFAAPALALIGALARSMLREGLRSYLPGHLAVGTRSACTRISAEYARAHERPGCMLLLDRTGPAPLCADPGQRHLGLGTKPERPGLAPRLAGPVELDNDDGPAPGRGPAAGELIAAVPGRPRPSSARRHLGLRLPAPSPRMQYTSSSFAQMLVGMFAWVLRPRTHRPTELPMFPRQADFHSEVLDPVLDEAVLPSFHFSAWLFSGFRVFQRGNIQAYLLYIFLVLIILLLWR